VGSFLLGLSFAVFLYNLWKTFRSGAKAPADPWNGATLEWAIPSPPQEWNFTEIPHVDGRDALWELKRAKGGKLPEPALSSGKGIHMPNPSYWPFVVGVGVTVTLCGFIAGFPYVNIIGAVILFVGVFKWAFEPA